MDSNAWKESKKDSDFKLPSIYEKDNNAFSSQNINDFERGSV